MTVLDQVRAFWEDHPLWTGVSVHEAGSVQHRYVDKHLVFAIYATLQKPCAD